MKDFELSQEDLSQLVFKDDLTGLRNRRFMYQYFKKQISWEDKNPPQLSLMMIDVDFFKTINDTYGHLEGDNLLKQLANALTKKLRENDIPIRYAGDEFSVLLPETDKATARQVANAIWQHVSQTKFTPREKGKPITITISLGLATFPEDAQDAESLIDEADKALYHSKNKGKNQVSEAKKLDEEAVAAHDLLKTIPCPDFVGRDEMIAELKKLVAKTKDHENIFVFLEGEVGVGKTRTLKKLEEKSEAETFAAFILCNEINRQSPYHSIIAPLKKIISSEKDAFTEILPKIEAGQLIELKRVFPDLTGEPKETTLDKSSKENRKVLFEGLISLLVAVSEIKPILFLFDEFQNIDDGSLEIITCLNESDEGRVLTCGAFRSSYLDTLSARHPGLEKFLGEIAGTPNFSHQVLVVFDQTLTNKLIDTILPNREAPAGFEQKMHEVTQGNALFIEEVIKNFILRKKMHLKNKKWVFDEIKPEEWPKNLDEVIMDNLVRLDQPTAKIVSEAAVMGRQMDLDVIKEVTQTNEGEALEILDKARDARLIKESDSLKTDNFTFVNQRIQEVAYKSIDEEKRREIHEQIGQAEETVHKDQLDDDLNALAYHFSKSGNEEKAAEYGERLTEVSGSIFRHEEATEYFQHGRMIVRSKIKEALQPLPETFNPTLREVFRGITTAAKNMKLYPQGSQLITNAFKTLMKSINNIFKQENKFTISEAKNILHVNTIAVESTTFGTSVNELRVLLKDHYIKSCTIQRGITEKEIERFLKNLDNSQEKGFSESGYWNKFLEEKQIENIGIAQRAFVVTQTKISSRLSDVDKEKLAADELTIQVIKDLLRYFCGAVENIKLYPSGSQLTTNAVDQVYDLVNELFKKVNIINFSEVEDILLINSTHINPKIFGTAVNTMTQFIKNYGFKSFTIMKSVNRTELERFLTILSNPPKGGKIPLEEWDNLIRGSGINNIIVGQLVYKSADGKRGTGRAGTGPGPAGGPGGGTGTPGSGGPAGVGTSGAPQRGPTGPSDKVLQLKIDRFIKDKPEGLINPDFPQIIQKLESTGQSDIQGQLLTKFAENLQDKRPEIRSKAGSFYLDLLNRTPNQLKKTIVTRTTPALLNILRQEKEGLAYDGLLEIANEHLAINLENSDLKSLKNLIWALGKDRQKDTSFTPELKVKAQQSLKKIMDHPSFPKIIGGLKSNDPTVQQIIVQIFAGFGAMVTPLIIKLIKESEALHLREAGASLINGYGNAAKALLMNDLTQITDPKQLKRIIGVIEIINPPELNEFLFEYSGHADSKIRTEAITTIGRLEQEKAVLILTELLGHKKAAVVSLAITTAGELGYAEVVPGIIELLEKTRNKKFLKECCASLGKIGDVRAIPALANILRRKKFLGLFGGYADEIRGTATWALGHFNDASSRQYLEEALNDKSPVVRSAAKLGLKNSR